MKGLLSQIEEVFAKENQTEFACLTKDSKKEIFNLANKNGLFLSYIDVDNQKVLFVYSQGKSEISLEFNYEVDNEEVDELEEAADYLTEFNIEVKKWYDTGLTKNAFREMKQILAE